MYSGNVSFTRALLLCLSVLWLGLSATPMAHASTWVPIKNGNHLIFIPKAGLDSAQVDAFQYGPDAIVNLNGFGSTSAIYFQSQSWTNGSYGALGPWQCHDKATLAANNNALKIPLVSGRYQLNVAAVMAKDSCDIAAFSAGDLTRSTTYTSNEFMVINHNQLACTDGTGAAQNCLQQDPTIDSPDAVSRSGEKDSYDMHLNWPVVEGVDGYGLVLTKDGVDYPRPTVPASEYHAASSHYLVEDTYNIANDTFSLYTGFGEYDFSITYCFNSVCSTPLTSANTVNILPIYPMRFEAIATNQNHDAKLIIRGDKRTPYYHITNLFNPESTSVGDIGTSFELDLTTAQMTDESDATTPGKNIGQALYSHTLTPNSDGIYKYNIRACSARHCQAPKQQYIGNVLINKDVNLPFGRVTHFNVGDTALNGWASDKDALSVPVKLFVILPGLAPIGLHDDLRYANLPGGQAGLSNAFAYPDFKTLLETKNIPLDQPFTLSIQAYDAPGALIYKEIDRIDFLQFYNQPPIAQNDSLDSTVNANFTFDPLVNDHDPEGQSMLLSGVTDGLYGTVRIENNVLVYTDRADNAPTTDTDSFTYTLIDVQNAVSNTATVTVNFTDFNYTPTITLISAKTVLEDTSTGALSLVVSDQNDGPDALNVSVVGSSNATVIDASGVTFGGSGANRTVTLQPKANQHGQSDLVFKVSDGVLETTTTLRLTVTSVNDAPVAQAQALSTNEDVAKAFVLTASDVENDPLIYHLVTGPANGTLSGSGTTRTYTPNANFNGTDRITFKVNDGTVDSAVAAIDITVNSVNDTPVAQAQALSTDEDVAKAFTLIASDADNDPLTYHLVTGPANGTLSGSGTNRTYTPNANFNGTDRVTFKVNDGTVDSAVAVVDITVNSVNDAPIISGTSPTSVLQGDNYLFVPIATDADVDDTLTWTITGKPDWLSFTESQQTLSGTPADEDVGVQSTLRITVTDSTGLSASLAPFTLTVINKNDAPQAINDIATTNEDVAVTVAVLTNDTDPDLDSGDVLTVTSASALNGTVSINTGTTVTYTPNTHYHGSDTITYHIADAVGITSSATVAMTVQSVNDLPVAVNDQTILDEDSSVTLNVLTNDTDIDGDALTVVSASALHGTVSINGGTTVTYTPNAHYHGNDTIDYTINDIHQGAASATVAVTVNSINDLPVLTHGSWTVAEDSLAEIDLNTLVSDVDVNSTLTIELVTMAPAQRGLVSPSQVITGVYHYTPDPDFYGTDSFQYQVKDETGAYALGTGTVNLTITGVNDAPVINAQTSLSTDEETALTLSMADFTIVDPDSNSFTISLTDGSNYSRNGNTVTPLPGFSGQLTIPVMVSDGETQASSHYQAKVTVNFTDRDWMETGGTVTDALISNVIPSASNFTGAMPGGASVSGGAASYNIPITLPPGRAGIQPSVSLGYSSRSGNGLVGVGWNLSAGGAISRCGETWAQDDMLGSVTYSADNDRLCLNGQRLMVTSGGYGTNRATYATEMDNFAVVTQLGGGINGASTYFEVKHASGQKQFYGRTSDSALSRVTPTGAPAPLSWLVSREQDVSGKNHMTYLYRDEGHGEILLEDILYTGDGTTDGDRKVHFAYETRAKFSTSYQAGGKTRQTKRLKSIKTFIGATTEDNSGTKVRGYTLTYKTALGSGRSLLTAVTACGYQGTTTLCHQPTTFDWSDAPTLFKTELLTDSANTELFPPLDYPFDNGNTAEVATTLMNVVPRGDSNGDGVRDIQGHYLNAEGDSTPNQLELEGCSTNNWLGGYSCHSADFNLDGKTDEWRGSGSSLQIRYNTPSTNTQSDWLDTPIALRAGDESSRLFAMQDFNGDGWVDIFYVYKRPDGEDYVLYLHSGDSSDPFKDPGLFKFSIEEVESALSESVQLMGDMNGDGLPDLVFSHIHKNNLTPKLTTLRLTRLIPKTRSGGRAYMDADFTDSVSVAFTDTQNLAEYTKFIDVNGDGLPDWLGLKAPDNDSIIAGDVFLKLNQGDGTFAADINLGKQMALKTVIRSETPTDPKSDEEHSMPKYGDAFKVMDVDGDGRSELIMPGTRLVEGCQTVNIPQETTLCGDDLYRQYLVNGATLSSVPSNSDFSIYQYDALHFSEDVHGVFSAEVKPTDLVGAANHAVVVDTLGKGLPDLMFAYGCYFPRSVSGCSIGAVTAGSVMDGKKENKIYFSRNYGATTNRLAPTKTDYEPGDMLQKATNGQGIISQWDYRPLSSKEYGQQFYTVNFDDVVDAHHFHFASSMYVVAKFEQSNGLGSFNAKTWQYNGAMYNTQGRGFRGFRTITETDVANDNLTTSTTFEQKFPFSSQVLSQIVSWTNESGATVTLSERSNQWLRNPAHQSTAGTSGLYHVYNERAESFTCDLSNTSACTATNRLSQNVSAIDGGQIDRYGNVKRKTTEVTDAYGTQTTVVDSVFDTSPFVHEVTSQTVTQSMSHSNGPDTTSQSGVDTNTDSVVTTHYVDYDATHHKPTTVIVAAGASALSDCDNTDCIKTVSSLNAQGLPDDVTVTGSILTGMDDTAQLQTRTTTLTYTNPDGYFPQTVTQMVGSTHHTSIVLTDPATGLNTQSTDAADIVTSTQYDALGRPKQINRTGFPAQYLRYLNADGSAPLNAIMKIGTYQAGAPSSVAYQDKLGRTLRTQTEDFTSGQTTQDVVYNARGLKVSESAPYTAGSSSTIHNTVYNRYDVLGRAAQKVTPQTNGTLTANYTYNGLTTTINTLVSEGHNLNMTRTYNSRQQLVETVDDKGGVTSYAYNGGGSPVVIKDAAGNRIVAKYDALGRKEWVEDPNQGTTHFVYNSFGELEKETDANGKHIRYKMDTLGRVTTRYADGSQANFTWDSEKKGLLTSHSENGISKTLTYDDSARVLTSTINVDNIPYTTTNQYDDYYGRLKSLEYPNQLTVGLEYNDRGYLTKEYNAASKYIYRQTTAQDIWGNATHSCMAGSSDSSCGTGASGFNLTADTAYSEISGQMLSTQATGFVNGGTGIVHHRAYEQYDSYGNLLVQKNKVAGLLATDTFVYDELHRLTSSSLTGPVSSTTTYSYDAVGNFLKKSDYSTDSNGAYQYKPGTNQISSVNLKVGGTATFTYDLKGNQTHRNGTREVWYNSFNKPTDINRLDAELDFTYGADLARYKQVRVVNGETITTHYIDKLYEVEKNSNGHETTKAYISDVAIITGGSERNIRYTLRDRLGSATTFTDDLGQATTYRHFDPFGKTMSGDWRELNPARMSENPEEDRFRLPTRRGFTDHEHLDEVELIHMNGRVYDYNVGRFMSVDPVIQSPTNSQSLNPYSYIMNNPLAGTDPTGYVAETPWDVASVIYDVGKISYGYLTNNPTIVSDGLVDLAADSIAVVTPFLPAGTTKVGRVVVEGVELASSSKKVSKAKRRRANNGSDVNSSSAQNSDKKTTEIGSFLEGDKRKESRQHAQEAADAGCCLEGVWDPEGAKKRRRNNLKGIATESGKDRDEFPPAALKLDDDSKQSVKKIRSSDNRSSGSGLGHEIKQKGVKPGDRVKIVISQGPVTGNTRVYTKRDSLENKKRDKQQRKKRDKKE